MKSAVALKQHKHQDSSHTEPTSLTGIIHQDDFRKQVVRWPVYHTVHSPKQSAPGFIVKHNNHTCVGKFIGIDFSLAPAKKNPKQKKKFIFKKIPKELYQQDSLEKGLQACKRNTFQTSYWSLQAPSLQPKEGRNLKFCFLTKKTQQSTQRKVALLHSQLPRAHSLLTLTWYAK